MMERGTSKVPLERAFDVARALDLDPTWFLERMLRDRAETLPLADHLFGPGGPLHGASPAITPPPERVERGPEAAAPAGAGGAGDERRPEPERVGGGEQGAPSRPGAGRPAGTAAVGPSAPVAADAGAARRGPSPSPPAPRPTPWRIEYEGVLRIFPPSAAARPEAP
jgi:hypothetical protein